MGKRKPDLRTWIKKGKIHIGNFADRCEVSRQTLYQIMNGKVDPAFEVAYRIWHETGCEVSIVSLKPSLKRMLPTIKEKG